MTQSKFFPLLALLISALFAPSAFSDWSLVNERSKLTFVSTKATHKAEVQKFTSLGGVVAKNGDVEIAIDLASIASGIEIRDTRMQEHLFEVATYPSAKITGNVKNVLKALKNNGYAREKLALTLDLHGVKKQIDVAVLAIPAGKKSFFVTTLKPVLIDAKDFGLVDGIEKLRELAGLPSISYTVPVSFNLTFSK